MFKLSHEVPIELLEESRNFNDYDYALVHLFSKHPKYKEFFKDSIKQGRAVILDNSAYELGKPFNSYHYKREILELEPTVYVLPDYRDDSKRTIREAQEWNLESPSLRMGVVHGSTYVDYCNCYRELRKVCDVIAFSADNFLFDLALISNRTPAEERVELLHNMVLDGVIDQSFPHHILGALSPTEYQSYINYDWIKTADTSNPVLHGLIGQRYEGELGLLEKSEIKLDSLINKSVSELDRQTVLFNVKWFRDQLQRDRVDRVLSIAHPSAEEQARADYYRVFPIETIELMKRVWGYEMAATWCEMTAFKYRMRLGLKTESVDVDIQKEKNYLNMAKKLREEK